MAITIRALADEASPYEIATPCPACSGDEFDVLLTPGDLRHEQEWLRSFYSRRSASEKDLCDFTQSEKTFIVACQGCGTVLRNPRPSAAELIKRYRGDTYGEKTLGDMLNAERDFFAGKAAQFKHLTAGSRVLEVGSFVGAFLEAGRSLHWDITGLDIGDETSAFCLANGHDVFKGDLSQVVGEFDAIFIWNTFDQLPHPRSSLREAQRLLKNDGLLVIRIPNGAFERTAIELKRTRQKSCEGIMAAMAYNNFLTFPYLAGYTPKAINEMLEDEDFTVRSLQGDTILPLHLDSEKARAEEQRFKRATMRACRLSPDLSCPWLDIVAGAAAPKP